VGARVQEQLVFIQAKAKVRCRRKDAILLPLLLVLQTLAKLCRNGSTQHFMYIMSPLTAQITTLVITTQTAHLQDEIRKCGHQAVKISCLLGSSVPSPVETVGPLPKIYLRRHDTKPLVSPAPRRRLHFAYHSTYCGVVHRLHEQGFQVTPQLDEFTVDTSIHG
jgi:hypothetical protein